MVCYKATPNEQRIEKLAMAWKKKLLAEYSPKREETQ